ncbi:MAG: hypothetical protein K8W52_11940 [Deltaproteobacteria bacterium]|nr:hypothetical protein [Deltaproteobacteria bacterium]
MTAEDRTRALLAAFADDPASLTAAERAEVEALLAHDADARAEAKAVRELLGAVRDLPQPTPPAWDALARSIGDAIDRAGPPSRWARLRAWILRPSIGIGVACAAAAAVGLWIAKRPASEPVLAHVDTPAIDAGAPVAPVVAPPRLFHDDPATAGELADLDQLDDAALDRLAASLGADPVDEIDDDNGGFAALDHDHRDHHAHHAAVAAADDPELDADSDALGDPDLDWVDELSDDDAAALTQWLTTHRSPT